ncbi:hypothetical protein Q4511_05120 [Paracoccus sp. 1_MG-2023]|uniref:hypothetical protein n=1 Tax=unclassified Paracoccus (in: a-proteobacteria) TaxID=2688777 RepID=UPI001C095575|nr:MULTISPECIES: hypothetical protein [unclassified Paracoccus (in: a-proteobacteria)]MBU2958171.1 hypothetical protein [Paracoccus sp. C2R09]MDO6668298.1 hypothetical protein [Paracoccus sp. 1_MG-2023]
MIGVVVWSCASLEKAIIWCEDQDNLAYLKGTTGLAQPIQWPEAGDLVELETEAVGNLRQAFGVTMLSEKSCPELPRMLSEAERPVARPPHLRVVSSQLEARAPQRATTASWPRSGTAC